MVKGQIYEKKGYYYTVLSYKDETGKWKKHWRATGLEVKPGNKRKAQLMLDEARMSFKPPVRADSEELRDMLYADYAAFAD